YLSPACWMYPNCNKANSDSGEVYLDPMSRIPCPTNTALCQQIIDLSDGVQNRINVFPELDATCRETPGWGTHTSVLGATPSPEINPNSGSITNPNPGL